MVEWNTGMTLVVLAISFLKQFCMGVCNGSESLRVKSKLCREGKPGGAVNVSE